MDKDGKLFPHDIEQAAAAWAARIDGGGLSPKDAQVLEQWLAADPRHRTCLEDYRRFSAGLGAALPALARAGAVRMPAAPASTPRGGVRWAAGLAAALLAVMASGYLVFRVASRPQETVTGNDERRSLTLADGTRADLNSGTQVAFYLTKTVRCVRLFRGEATFAVAKDPLRPFVVETPGGAIRDTGTVFNVRADGTGRLDVTVLEGSVQVSRPEPGSPGGRIVSLRAGQRALLAGPEVQVRKLGADCLRDAVAWRQGGVVFQGVTLGEALDRFARFDGRKITVAPAVAGLRVGGRFSLEDIDGFAAALEKTLPVRVSRAADGSLVVAAAGISPR